MEESIKLRIHKLWDIYADESDRLFDIAWNDNGLSEENPYIKYEMIEWAIDKLVELFPDCDKEVING